MEPYHNPRSRRVSMELALTARGAVEVEGKGKMYTFSLMPADGNTHSVEGARI
jgi:hypothetical protein